MLLVRAVAILPILAVLGVAQDTGRISGVIEDESGAIVPGAVTAEESEMGFSR